MEEREPAHIHVAHAGRYAKFWLDPVAVAEVRRFRAHELADIQRVVLEKQEFFLEAWYDSFGREM
ncbi:MAG: DUF4160 domain-containing protein [Candidatus Sumerlaeota bacterium]|nr:DUF4160 domain-containing protein [Candidatus Sumerlaeota bacterium]